jgi:hypothetical protein
VVERGSFAKAAELIGITDSGVSRATSRLETRLGVRLLNRTTRSVTLTDEGRRFYEKVSPHLSAIEDAAVVASGAVSAVRGRLRVRSPQSMGSTHSECGLRSIVRGAVMRTDFSRAKIGKPSRTQAAVAARHVHGFLSEDAERAAGCQMAPAFPFPELLFATGSSRLRVGA